MTDLSPRIPMLIAVRRWLWNSGLRLLWLCAYATAAVLAVGYFFVINDQGQDLLRISTEPARLWWNLSFAVAALLLGLSLWYSARLLLAWDHARDCLEDCLATFRADCVADCDPASEGAQPLRPNEPVAKAPGSAAGDLSWWRTWLPRAYGAAIPALIGLAFLMLDTQQPITAWLFGVLYLILAVAIFVFFVKRRDWFLGGSRRGLNELTIPRDRRRMVWVLIVALLSALLLMAAFIAQPVSLPQLLGAPAILLLGLAGIALFGGLVLTYAFLAWGQQPATTLALLIAVGVGLVVDNHLVRLDPTAPPPNRLPAEQRLKAWDLANPPLARVGERRPVIIVAASGGGIRAAYWTASVLAGLETTPGFSQSLFAISGVSGGSVGAATYAAIKRRQLEAGLDPETLSAVRTAMSHDFLSPAVAGMLFPDLAQRFVPVSVQAADRQRFLELGFEAAIGAGPNPLAGAFTALYADGYADRLPNLMLNTTVVDSGRRAIFSSIPVDQFSDTLDLMAERFDTQAVRLSAAAGASARFTYVSPAGSLYGPGTENPVGPATTADGEANAASPGEAPRQKIRLVDGGYFENSGAATAVDLLNQIDSPAIYPILILIRNDPMAPPVCRNRHPEIPAGPGPAGPPAVNLLSEVTSPFRALLNGRTARGTLAEVDAAKRFERSRGAVIEVSLAAVVRAEEALLNQEQPDLRQRQRAEERLRNRLVEPPLGWSLSGAVRTAMDRALDGRQGGLDREINNLAAVLAGNADAYVNCKVR